MDSSSIKTLVSDEYFVTEPEPWSAAILFALEQALVGGYFALVLQLLASVCTWTMLPQRPAAGILPAGCKILNKITALSFE
jgi:hypothetical protein